jgi:RNA 2',3'-cyclic 3'-phosphodiesterase
MTALRRAFLAVVPPPATRAWAESVANSAEAIAPDLRWTRTDQRHLTVRFLGHVPDLPPVAEFVADSVRRRSPFTLSLGGGGAFPGPRRASVLWLGVREGSDALSALAATVAEPDDHPFRAHLTLARAKRPRDLRQVVDALDASGESEPWIVDEVVLFESDGSTHTEQARFRLAG